MCSSISAAVGRCAGSDVKHIFTKSLAVSETFAQYSSRGKWSKNKQRENHRIEQLTGFKFEISVNDGLHFLLLTVSIKGSIATQEEIGDDANSPDIDGFSMASWKRSTRSLNFDRKKKSREKKRTSFEYFRSHVLIIIIIIRTKWFQVCQKVTLTPGVPQISVKTVSFSSSMTRLRPKSAIIMSASSAFERNKRFSGFRSTRCQQPN